MINYQLSESGFVNLIVYNSLGQEITELVNYYQTKGNYSINFNAKNLSSGVYVYRIAIYSDKLNSGKFFAAKKNVGF